MKLYVWVTQDKYQLPLFVSEEPKELARVSGYKVNTIYRYISKGNKEYIKNPCFVAVEVDG